jgi:hypothetical protein
MTLSRALGIGLAVFIALYGASHLAVAEGPLAVSGGGTGASFFQQGSIPSDSSDASFQRAFTDISGLYSMKALYI